jgi:DNA-binding transcriptional regulator YiaG
VLDGGSGVSRWRRGRAHRTSLNLADPTNRTLYDAAVAEVEAEVHRHRLALVAVRRAMGLTQAQLATEMGTSQSEVSRIEHQADWLLTTLRSYVRAAGGELTLLVRLPGQAEAELDLDAVLGGRGEGVLRPG